MSHLHLPDGVLPLWLLILGYLFVFIYLIFLFLYIKKIGVTKKLTLVGVISALMLIAMSLEIFPIAYHINLAVLSGIILGPVYSILAAFIVNLILSLLGHGGFTVVGLNTIIISVESLLGFFGYKFLKKKFKNAFTPVFLTTFISLLLTSFVTIGIVYLGNQDPAEIVHNHHKHEKTENKEKSEKFHHDEIDIKRFLMLVLTLGSMGWAIESFVTAFIVSYINKINPSITENSSSKVI